MPSSTVQSWPLPHARGFIDPVFGKEGGELYLLTAARSLQMLQGRLLLMEDSADQSLTLAIDRIHSGDKAALGTVYDMYGKVVYSVSLKILKHVSDAEEATQDAFLSLWENADSLQGKPAKVLPWLIRVVRNRSIDKMRKANRRPPTAQTIEPPEPGIQEKNHAEKTTALDALLNLERADRVKLAVSQLPPEQKVVIELAYFKGFTQSEIARELDESLGTVKSRTRYALIRLKTEMEGSHVV